MKTKQIFYLCLFFIFHSSFFFLSAQPQEQYPMNVNVLTVDELPKDVYSKLRIGLNGGGVYRIAKLQSSKNQQIDDFFQRLRWGMTFNADLTYFFSQEFGVGALYSYARHSNKINNFEYEPYPESFPQKNGILDDRIVIQFIGPAFQYRYNINYRGDAFTSHIALGYVDYRDKFFSPYAYPDFNTSSTPSSGGWKKASSGVFGVHLGIGYDFALSETWALGVQLAGLIATRSKEKRTDDNGQTASINLDKNSIDNLARVELTVGLRFNK